MYQRLIEYKNKHKNDKVLFLGTGTSLLDFDLSKLNKEIYTFAFNRFIPFYKEFWPDLRLDFFMCHDPTVFHTSFVKQLEMRQLEADEQYEEGTKIIKYKNTSTAEYILNSELYKTTKIIFPGDLLTAHADRFGLPHNKDWAEQNKEIMNHPNFLPYKNDPDYKNAEIKNNDNEIIVGTWAKNSFCNSALPMLFFMGFKEIYLAGVDYSHKGYFFSQAKNHAGYIPREHDEFDSLKSKSKIFVVEHKDTQIKGKDGCISFENLLG